MNGKIESDTFYVWDNWGYMSKAGDLHIHAQYCEKHLCEVPEDRYWHAKIQHFVSMDKGESFMNRGTVIDVSKDSEHFDAFNIWSGCVYELDDGRVMSLYTGLSSSDKRLAGNRRCALQSIGLAISHDGGVSFTKNPEPIISPIRDYELLRRLGYFLGPKESLGEIDDPDGTFMCLRDPELFVEDETIHMIFACKVACKGVSSGIRNGVGHAVIKDFNNLSSIEIMRPIFVAKETDYNQLELPGLFKAGAKYYLVVSTTNLEYIGQPDTEVEKTVRIFVTDNLQTNQWNPFGDEGSHIILNSSRDGIYGPKIIHNYMKDVHYCFRPFVVGETFAPRSIGIQLLEDKAKIIHY